MCFVKRLTNYTKYVLNKNFVFNFKILAGKANIERILITKHREEEVIDHILQSDSKLTIGKEEGVKRRAPTTHQVFKALGISKTFEGSWKLLPISGYRRTLDN